MDTSQSDKTSVRLEMAWQESLLFRVGRVVGCDSDCVSAEIEILRGFIAIIY